MPMIKAGSAAPVVVPPVPFYRDGKLVVPGKPEAVAAAPDAPAAPVVPPVPAPVPVVPEAPAAPVVPVEAPPVAPAQPVAPPQPPAESKDHLGEALAAARRREAAAEAREAAIAQREATLAAAKPVVDEALASKAAKFDKLMDRLKLSPRDPTILLELNELVDLPKVTFENIAKAAADGGASELQRQLIRENLKTQDALAARDAKDAAAATAAAAESDRREMEALRTKLIAEAKNVLETGGDALRLAKRKGGAAVNDLMQGIYAYCADTGREPNRTQIEAMAKGVELAYRTDYDQAHAELGGAPAPKPVAVHVAAAPVVPKPAPAAAPVAAPAAKPAPAADGKPISLGFGKRPTLPSVLSNINAAAAKGALSWTETVH